MLEFIGWFWSPIPRLLQKLSKTRIDMIYKSKSSETKYIRLINLLWQTAILVSYLPSESTAFFSKKLLNWEAANRSNTVELNPQIEAVSFISLEQSGKVRNGKLRITFGKLLCGLHSGYTFNSWHFPMKSIEYWIKRLQTDLTKLN